MSYRSTPPRWSDILQAHRVLHQSDHTNANARRHMQVTVVERRPFSYRLEQRLTPLDEVIDDTLLSPGERPLYAPRTAR